MGKCVWTGDFFKGGSVGHRKRKREDDGQVRNGRQPRTPPRSDSGMRPSPSFDRAHDRHEVNGEPARYNEASRGDREGRARRAFEDGRHTSERPGRRAAERDDRRGYDRHQDDRRPRSVIERPGGDRRHMERIPVKESMGRDDRDGRDKRRRASERDGMSRRHAEEKRAQTPDLMDRWDGGDADHH
jgi:hypothetical protein